jgi:hypothetical protein
MNGRSREKTPLKVILPELKNGLSEQKKKSKSLLDKILHTLANNRSK